MKRIIKTIYLFALFILASNIAYANEGKPSENDISSIEIVGIEDKSTVVAYKIVDAIYNEFGLLGYEQNEVTKEICEIVDLETPTYEEISKLSYEIQNNNLLKENLDKINLNYNVENGVYYTDNAKAGSYLIFVEHESYGYIYNPILASVFYKDANVSSSINKIDSAVNVDSYMSLKEEKLYAKKDNINFEKNIVNSSTGNKKFDDVKIGDEIEFEIISSIPDYSEAFNDEFISKIKYSISDKMIKGLDCPKYENIGIFILGNELTEDTLVEPDNYKIDILDHEFVVEFDPFWIIKNANNKIKISYKSILNNDALMANYSNVNKAKLEYSTVFNETKTIESLTRHYTFDFRIFKSDVNNSALSGAIFEFGLLTDGDTPENYNDFKHKYTVESDEFGVVAFHGIDAGTYILKEVKAPTGKVLSDKEWCVKIVPKYNELDEKIEEYSVIIYDLNEISNMHEYVYAIMEWSEDKNNVETIINFNDLDYNEPILTVVNTNLKKLPSTGGYGTTLIVIIGGILVVLGFLISKKNNEK